ncbi:MAG: glycerol-3-phosphate responsive antiterminator [Provencibacterium sp.]|jgi:glycerol uptake operon antiterminator|nr:glycerol-3-phosphate responsive antiterminator [Provencibacterium sp.]
MTREELVTLLDESPVVAAVKDDPGLQRCLFSECRVAFILYGDICTVPAIISALKKTGKVVFVHIDLIDGLSAREVAVDFIAENTHADGIISTRPALIRHAREQGLFTVQRFFLLDSIALQNVQRQMESGSADLIEILPGVMPKIIRRLAGSSGKPLIAGGLISDKEDILQALGAGAIAISSTNEGVWFM